jgi:hypothetical protein
LRRFTNSAATKKTPIAMMTAAATFSSAPRLSWSLEPRPVAVGPRRMKIVEKLAMNSRLGPSTRHTGARSSSAADTPVTADR